MRLVAILFVSLLIVHNAWAARTFELPMGIIHFTGSTLIVCTKMVESDCRAIPLQAQDVVPFEKESGTSRLLVIDDPTRYRSCDTFLKCDRLTLFDLTGAISPTVTSTRVKAGEYACSYTFRTGLNCSSAQPFTKRSRREILFGDFTGKGATQVLSVADRSLVCEIGGRCRAAQGLELLQQTTMLASVERISSDTDRSLIYGVGPNAMVTCVAYFDSPTSVGFHCQQDLHEQPGPMIPHTVKWGDGVETMMHARPRKASGPVPSHETSNADIERAAGADKRIRTLGAATYLNAGLAIKSRRVSADHDFDGNGARIYRTSLMNVACTNVLPSNFTDQESDAELQDHHFHKVINCQQVFVPTPFIQSFYLSPGNFTDSFGRVVGVAPDDWWSDEFGISFTDYNANLPGENYVQCIARCDKNATARRDVCNFAAGQVRQVATLISVGVGVAVGTRAGYTGGFAAYGIASGVLTTAAQNYDSACQNAAISALGQCRSTCH